MDERVIQLLTQLLEKSTTINFFAKWRMDIIVAKEVTPGVYAYVLPDKCIPVNEVYKLPGGGYGYDHLNNDMVALKILHGSTAVNLLQAYNGINLDMSSPVIPAGEYRKRWFNTDEEKALGVTAKSNVVAGDSVAVLVPQT